MIKFNKKAIMSLLLSGSIALSAYGCTRDIKNKHDEDNDTKLTVVEVTDIPVEKQTQYVNKRNEIIDLNVLNNSQYLPIEGDNKYTLYNGSSIYYKFDWNITDEEIADRSFIVSAVAASDTFTIVELPNGNKAYVSNGSLIKCANLHNSEYQYVNEDSSLISDAYLYDGSGMYIGYLHEMQPCYKVAVNNEYALINLPDGTNGYVVDRALENNYQQIDGAAFIKAGTDLYLDKNLKELYRTSNDEMVYVEFMTNRYAAIFDTTGRELLYVNPEALDDDFVLVDLDKQQMDCYVDYQLAGSWGTRTGRDSSPTHAGAFDIDWKAADWEFTTFPGSYAKHWIPINEYGEGIHDLIGDDEQNYGNEAYHAYGSHGCIRVPREASQFVFDNYEVGDMVLVRKK